ncbi:MAG: hypothetical protein AAF609_14260 [Cyanobacteria bacterium P01_C01_bin.120]
MLSQQLKARVSGLNNATGVIPGVLLPAEPFMLWCKRLETSYGYGQNYVTIGV